MTTKESISGRFITFCVVAFIVTFGVAYLVLQPAVEANVEFSVMDMPREGLLNREIALTFFGCSTCPAATDERIPSIVKQLSKRVGDEAVSKGYAYILIGVSNEGTVEEGLDYLMRIADFDEISLGNGMGNTALQHYVWENFDHALSGATPQVILSSRVYDTLSTGGSEPTLFPEIISDEILWREVGVSAIERLIQNDGFFELF